MVATEVSAFRRKKYMHIFNSFFDIDKSGSIEKTDFELAVKNIAKLRGWQPGEIVYELMKDMLMNTWVNLAKDLGKPDDGHVSQEEWVALWDKYAQNPDKAAKWQQIYCKSVFQLEDASNDGAIDCDEFVSVYESFGLDKKASTEAFQKLVKGKDQITWEEFQQLWREYFTSEDPQDSGNFIFGRYCSCVCSLMLA